MSDQQKGNQGNQAQERANSVAVIVQLFNEEWDIDIAPWLLERLSHLAKHTPTTADETSALRYAGQIFNHIKEVDSHRAYSREERLLVRIGTLFSDIGKTGPAHATPNQQELIVRIFAIENVPNRETLLLTDFFTKYLKRPWADDWKYRFLRPLWQRHLRRTIRGVGVDPDTTTLKALHDLHSSWTLDLLSQKDSGIPARAIPAAACHHRLSGDNPKNIIAEDDTYTVTFGRNTRYDRAEKLVSALDLYDAFRRRSEMSHDEAVEQLRQIVQSARDGFYASDAQFQEIIGDIDVILAETESTP